MAPAVSFGRERRTTTTCTCACVRSRTNTADLRFMHGPLFVACNLCMLFFFAIQRRRCKTPISAAAEVGAPSEERRVRPGRRRASSGVFSSSLSCFPDMLVHRRYLSASHVHPCCLSKRLACFINQIDSPFGHRGQSISSTVLVSGRGDVTRTGADGNFKYLFCWAPSMYRNGHM